MHQKLGVIRTLFDRKDNIVTEEADRIDEDKKIQTALFHCSYPKWASEKVKTQMKQPRQKDNSQKKDKNKKCRDMVVFPYVNGVSEKK